MSFVVTVVLFYDRRKREKENEREKEREKTKQKKDTVVARGVKKTIERSKERKDDVKNEGREFREKGEALER